MVLTSACFVAYVILISIFGWLGIAAYVRAEFLKNRTLDYVRAARALGQSNRMIMWRHILPNSLTPVVTLVPFEMASAIGALTSLDFLNLGVPPGTPSLGELLNQGKDNLDAWWIIVPTFALLERCITPPPVPRPDRRPKSRPTTAGRAGPRRR